MGSPQSKTKTTKPPAMILVPQPFDFPPAAARTRMAVPAYDLMFGKLSLRRLFGDYYPRQPGMNVDAGLLLRPPRPDSHVDLTATMFKGIGEALLRWQRDLDDPHTFVDLLVSPSKSMLKLRSCAYYPKYGIGAFGAFPLLMANRACSKDYGVMGLRYVSENLSIGASFVPFPSPDEVPYGAWLVGRKGRLSAGLQYKPLIASAYQRHVLQQRENEHLGSDHITGALAYIDFGLELATRVGKDKSSDSADKSLFQLAASCQINSYLLVKGKLGTSKSSAALAFKLPPYFRLSVTAENDRSKGISYGLGICVEEFLDHSYQTVDSDRTVLTETEELFDGEKKKRTFHFDCDAGEFDNLPAGLKPIDKIL